MNVDIFGYFAAILTTAAFLPQLIKTLKTKKADDVSLTTLIMFIIGLAYIFVGGDVPSSSVNDNYGQYDKGTALCDKGAYGQVNNLCK